MFETKIVENVFLAITNWILDVGVWRLDAGFRDIEGVGDIPSTEEAFKAKARAQADKLGIPYKDLGL